MNFNPDFCRNETEVESKLIVQYLLPKLGYSPETWHQEVTFGSIRLDFIAFAAQVIPFVLGTNSPLSIVMEAKHPNQNLDKHVRRLKRYLMSLNVEHGLLTNGKKIRIYKNSQDDIQLVFECSGKEVDTKFNQIKALIGRERNQEQPPRTPLEVKPPDSNLSNPQPLPHPICKKRYPVKIIAVYHNKGGVGKTTTVVNLAAAISKKGKRVLVIDLDSQANTTFATGLIKFDDEDFDDIKDSNIYYVLKSEELFPIQDVARKSQFSNPEITVIPSHITLMHNENELNQLDSSRMVLIQKLKKVESQYDVVIIDTPPSLNLYARIALIAADYLIIPSDLKPFANQGLLNVKDFIKTVNGYKKLIGKSPLQILGIVACKISTNARFVQTTLQKRIKKISERYDLQVMDTIIYDRDDLAKCAEKVQVVGDMEIADPISILDFKPDSLAAQEFELLAMEVLRKVGLD